MIDFFLPEYYDRLAMKSTNHIFLLPIWMQLEPY